MSRVTAIICAVIICLIVSLAWAANHYRESARKYKDDARAAKAITSNVITAVNLFNDIAKATHDAQQQNNAASQTRIVYIKEALKTDPCANQLVPSAAADQLRKHADSIRTGSRSTAG